MVRSHGGRGMHPERSVCLCFFSCTIFTLEMVVLHRAASVHLESWHAGGATPALLGASLCLTIIRSDYDTTTSKDIHIGHQVVWCQEECSGGVLLFLMFFSCQNTGTYPARPDWRYAVGVGSGNGGIALPRTPSVRLEGGMRRFNTSTSRWFGYLTISADHGTTTPCLWRHTTLITTPHHRTAQG